MSIETLKDAAPPSPAVDKLVEALRLISDMCEALSSSDEAASEGGYEPIYGQLIDRAGVLLASYEQENKS